MVPVIQSDPDKLEETSQLRSKDAVTVLSTILSQYYQNHLNYMS
jgi:hypothetical protein